ncbi:MAG: hypothetical protein PUP93_23425 [Rhizonema sp. NSF051]|nr:hypothetical protein [Rhizonema sp. NSF051]
MLNFYQSGGINICGCGCPCALLESDEEPPYPPFTGLEFLDTHDTIDDHPYATAFSKFLAVGIDSDTANELAFGIRAIRY